MTRPEELTTLAYRTRLLAVSSGSLRFPSFRAGGEVWKERDKGPDWSTERNEDRNRTVQHSSRRRSLARVSCCPYRSSLPRSYRPSSFLSTHYVRYAGGTTRRGGPRK